MVPDLDQTVQELRRPPQGKAMQGPEIQVCMDSHSSNPVKRLEGARVHFALSPPLSLPTKLASFHAVQILKLMYRDLVFEFTFMAPPAK